MWKSSVSGEFMYFASASGAQRAAAEGDDPAPRIRDREHDAVAETVVGDRDVVAVTHQPAGLDLRLADALRRPETPSAHCGCRAHSRAGTTAASPASGRGRADRRGPWRPPADCSWSWKNFVAISITSIRLVRCFSRCSARSSRAGIGTPASVGDALDGLRKAHAFEFGQEAEMVARHAAAEAMIAALLVLAVEARALLAVERAAGPIVAARRVGLLPVPRDALADHR